MSLTRLPGRRLPLPLPWALALLACLSSLAVGLPAAAQETSISEETTATGPANRRHHLGLSLGYQKLLSDDLKDDLSGIDFTNAGFASFFYRFSVRPNLDLTFDSRGTISSDEDLELTNYFFGPGLRLVSSKVGLRPFVQGNFFFVEEEISSDVGGTTLSASDSGVGFGVAAGVDIRASNLLSVPIEVNYMYGKPSDDISGVGVNVGLTFNFGMMK